MEQAQDTETPLVELKYNGHPEAFGLAYMTLMLLSGDKLKPIGEMAPEAFDIKPEEGEVLEEGTNVRPNAPAQVYRREKAPDSSDHKLVALAAFDLAEELAKEQGEGEVWRLFVVEAKDEGYVLHECAFSAGLAGFFGESETELLTMLGLEKDVLRA